MRSMAKRLGVFVALWMTGCFPSDPAPGPIMEELFERWDGAVASYCTCNLESYDSIASCEMRSTLNHATRECLLRTVDRVEESSKFLQCMLDVERAHERCIPQNLACDVVENCEVTRVLDRFTCVLDEYPLVADELKDACPLGTEGDPASAPAILFPF